MSLKTTYLGLELANPIIVGASPMTIEADMVKKLEDNGAAAIVTNSLWEEQITHEAKAIDAMLAQGEGTSAEALDYFPEPDQFHDMNGEAYLEKIRKIKESVSIPVIGSLNGVSAGGWMDYAKKIQEAGADALELNIYYIPTNFHLNGEDVEQMYVDDLKAVKQQVKIPVSVKLSPYFSSFASLARQLDQSGADGLVMFNRFYQPDINLDTLELEPSVELSTSTELRLPLRWLAILCGNVNCSLSATSGIHTAEDVIKSVMVGADSAQIVSVLLEKGPGAIREMIEGVQAWMDKNEYKSIEQMKGSMSYKSVAEPAAFERANYMKTLQSFQQNHGNF